MSLSISNGLSSQPQQNQSFRVYKQRWGVLLSVVLLNISCGSLWISYSSTATTVAKYYDVTPSQVNWFASCYFILAIPFTFVASFLVEKLGLKRLLHIGCGLNTVAAIVRALATSGLFKEPHTQYAISLAGQMFSASANSFFLGIGPKVSQIWFPESERDLATSIGALSRPLGVIITQMTVPYIIEEPEDVRLNSYIWLGPALLSQVVTTAFVTRAFPKTPPSHSSSESFKRVQEPFWTQLKSIFSSLSYLLIFMAVGGGVGFVFAMGALTEQILCPLGYTESYSGLVSALILGGGFVGAPLATTLLKRKPMYSEITKMFLAGANIFLIVMLELYLISDVEVALAIFAFIFGVFAVGSLPIGLELAIETTYPVDGTISSSFIFLSGQMQAMFFVILIPILAKEEEDTSLSYCGSHITPLNYRLPLLLLMGFISIFVYAFILFFNTEYKRQQEENKNRNEGQSKELRVTKL